MALQRFSESKERHAERKTNMHTSAHTRTHALPHQIYSKTMSIYSDYFGIIQRAFGHD